MRTIKLKRLEMENFRCFKNKVIEFGDRTTVKGQNGCGKSTLYNAVLWCLFDKDANGNNAANVRPHDSNSNDIDFVDIIVSCTFDVDGREIKLTKKQSQKWTKKRGSDSKTFDGNVNTFLINDIPKNQKSFKEYIKENMCDEETFLFCTNVQSFFRLDTKKRRQKLISLSGKITDADVIAASTAFETLSDLLKDGTVDELVTRSKSTIKRLNDNLKDVPVRIDELEKSKVDIDVAKLELAKNAVKEQIAEIEAKEADLSKQYAEYQAASDSVLQISFDMNEVKRKANEGLVSQQMAIQSNIDEKKIQLYKTENSIRENNRKVSERENELASRTQEREQLAKLWQTAKAESFDKSSAICPTCHRELPQEEIDRLVADYEKSKAERLERIINNGNAAKADIDKAAQAISKLKECNEINQKNKEGLEKEIAELNKQLSALPEEVDLSDNKEYQHLAKQLEEKEALLSNDTSASEMRHELSVQKHDAQTEIDLINAQLAKTSRNVDIDERVSELQIEQRKTAQWIADEEKQLDLLEEFNRKKMTMLTDSVNKRFKKVRWQLFSEQINGGYSDVCYALVDGTNYEKGLNDSDCLLADLDILQAFQRMNNLNIFLFLDRAESINDNRIPETDSQLILLKVSDEPEMIVTVNE